MISFSKPSDRREEIERQVREYKAKGGEIRKIPIGVGADFQTITQREANKRAKGVLHHDQTGV